MYGAYCAEKIFRAGESANLRVLVLEAGGLLVTEHVQNLARIGLNAAAPIPPANDPGVARNEVWGLPWRGTVPFPGIAYCIGGRSLYWGGWAPRLTSADLSQWPVDLAKAVMDTYPLTERETGVDEKTDYISGLLNTQLQQALNAAKGQVPSVDAIEDAPLAVQGKSPASGLFSFDKYSSAPILVDAIREAAGSPDALRRLFLVPRAHVIKLNTSNGLVTQIELEVNGQRKFLSISPDCAIILAASTVESTRLALHSFPTPIMGQNLMAHLRSNTIIRIRRTAIAGIPPGATLETAALLVRGSTVGGRYHLQVTASSSPGANSEAVMWRMIPDIDLLDKTLASQDPDWVVITLRGIGEMVGNKGQAQPNNWINLSPYENDEFGAPRAWVNLGINQNDEALWKTMDDAAVALAKKLALDDPNNIEYFYGGAWQKNPPASQNVRDGLGTTHHEAGTLWAGTDPLKSVTNLSGRFHHVRNAYVAGPSLFPTLGSANPAITSLSLGRITAKAVVEAISPSVPTGFTPLLKGTSLNGWQMAGFGQFNPLGRSVESEGGIGLLWYTPEEFADFILRAEWRASSPSDNSGIFLRFPVLGSNDPQNDWKVAVDNGYEVQIDDTGFNPKNNTFNDSLHRTGAIYGLAPSAKLVSKPLGEWNLYEIQAKGQKLQVRLNGELVTEYKDTGNRPLKGHIGLQNHHQGSRVGFRNVCIQKM